MILTRLIPQDELHRIKANCNNPSDSNGGHSAAWIRRSLHLLKSNLNCPITLCSVDDDGDEEMEIDEEDVERICDQVDKQIAGSEANNKIDLSLIKTVTSDLLFVAPKDVSFNESRCYTSAGGCIREQISEDTDVNMEEGASEQDEILIVDSAEPVGNTSNLSDVNVLNYDNLIEENHIESNTLDRDPSRPPADEKTILSSSISKLLNEESPSKNIMDNSSCSASEPLNGVSAGICSADAPNDFSNGSANCMSPPSLCIVPSDVSPVLKSPTPSVSPRISCSRKSLRTSSMLTASQKDLQDDNKLSPEAAHMSSKKSVRSSSSNALSTQSMNLLSPTEHLAASIRHGLEILDSHRQSAALRRSSFRFSFKPAESKAMLLVDKVDVGVQTFPGDIPEEDSVAFMCTSCKNRMQLEVKEADDSSNLQLVPVEGSESTDKLKKQVPKVSLETAGFPNIALDSSCLVDLFLSLSQAVEKVLAGAIRREMALEDFCAKQTSEIVQLNRLVCPFQVLPIANYSNYFLCWPDLFY